MYNILTEPLIRADIGGRAVARMSLPQVYAALMADEVEAFPALRSHQRHAWHAFLAQLGAMAMHKSMQKGGESDLPIDADAWRDLIRGLTSKWQDDEPWHLVVDDITAPAFMQPAARSADKWKDYKTSVATPDGLDMLVTSKNHDLKMAVGLDVGADDWIFALVSLQTQEGYQGRGNYGISRMPSGYGNRPAFSIAPSERPGLHLRRDLAGLMERRQAILEEYSLSDDGVGLVWTLPWDGSRAESLLLTDMDPFYIEICRRVRMRQSENKLVAIRANSGSRRMEDAKGLTGDPWAPVSSNVNARGTPPAFLAWPRKFGYERVVDGLTSPDWNQPALLRLTQQDKDFNQNSKLIARGIVRGEGGTRGYHERVIPLRPQTIQIFGRGGGAQQLGDIARERITQIGIVKGALRRGIAVFAANGNFETSEGQRARANDWGNKLDDIVDASFFEDLQDEFEADESDRGGIRNKWLRNTEDRDGVIEHAQRLLDEAGNALPCQSIYRYRAKVAAESEFWRRIRGPRGLPFLFHTQDDKKEEDECQNNSEQTQEQNPTGAQLNLI